MGEDQQPLFLRVKSLSQAFVLELIESVLVNNAELFMRHQEQIYLLRERLMPLIVASLSERMSFSLTVRVMRILSLLLRRHLEVIISESEMALSLLIHFLDQDASIPWKRVLCMEVFRQPYTDAKLIRHIYAQFDAQEGRKNILRDHLGALVKLASEKPSLIGLGRHSTMPRGSSSNQGFSEEQAALDTAGVGGFIGTAVTSSESETVGISAQWSTMRVPCLEMLDKSEPPHIPETYIYSLILNCIGSFTEGLAKFILPLTVPADARGKKKRKTASAAEKEGNAETSSGRPSVSSRQVSVNPLTLEDHVQFSNIKTTAAIIDTCWPAVLATCSTFLYATLDGDYYHALVRSFQRLTHVSGLLRLATPRDALLTTLGKAAVPADVLTASSPSLKSAQENLGASTSEAKTRQTENASSALSRGSVDVDSTLLSTRNLLCLRALINLGIALGPTLDKSAWAIILETLQQADIVISVSARAMSRQATSEFLSPNSAEADGNASKSTLGGEILAVQSASSKLFESTAEYPSDSFHELLRALLALFGEIEGPTVLAQVPMPAPDRLSPNPTLQPRKQGRVHQTSRSVSKTLSKSRVAIDEIRFALEKTEEVATSNLTRIALQEPKNSGWNLLMDSLTTVTSSTELDRSLRLKAAIITNNTVARAMQESCVAEDLHRRQIQQRSLQALVKQLNGICDATRSSTPAVHMVDLEVHELALETLQAVLEQCGETISAGWDLLFQILSSTFERSSDEHSTRLVARSLKCLRTAFSSLQLIGSDFLSLLPASHMMDLVNALHHFAAQRDDFNISLTSTTLFWNVSDFLQTQFQDLSLDPTLLNSSNAELEKIATDSDSRTSRSTLWLLLLLRIVDLCTDERQEIRNGSVQTVLRIFDAYGPLLSSDAWHLCLNMVLFRMLESLQSILAEATLRAQSSNTAFDKSLIETAVSATTGFTSLLAGFLDVLIAHTAFEKSWARLMSFFDILLTYELLEFDTAVFNGLEKILHQVKDQPRLDSASIDLSWQTWVSKNPARGQVVSKVVPKQENQDALIAYINAYDQLYRLKKGSLDTALAKAILDNFRTAIWGSVVSRYASDVERLSPLQIQVLRCTKDLCSENTKVQSVVVASLAEFCDCALTKQRAETDRPSFVAFSKAAMAQLSWCICDFGIRTDLFSNGTLLNALQHLNSPVQQKYRWQGKDKEPYLWQEATITALNILETAVPYVSSEKRDPEKCDQFWQQVVSLAANITSADTTRASSILTLASDEKFDITAFRRLQLLITRDLASPVVPDSCRRRYASAVFEASLVHSPHRHDLPQSGEAPLSRLYRSRHGRTFEPVPSIRCDMAYVLVEALFSLVSENADTDTSLVPSTQSGKTSVLLLARAVSPYLVLRCSLPLNSYIFDHPLRGRMPQPNSMRYEVLTILKHLHNLKSHPDALPRVKGVDSPDRKHLYWLYPLFEKAVGVAGKDPNDGAEIIYALQACLKDVGGNFGIGDGEADGNSSDEENDDAES